jgi:hypothetical protein
LLQLQKPLNVRNVFSSVSFRCWASYPPCTEDWTNPLNMAVKHRPFGLRILLPLYNYDKYMR